MAILVPVFGGFFKHWIITKKHLCLLILQCLKLGDITWGVLRHNGGLGGGNSNIFGMITPKLGEDEPNLTSIFRWVGEKPPTSNHMEYFPQKTNISPEKSWLKDDFPFVVERLFEVPINEGNHPPVVMFTPKDLNLASRALPASRAFALQVCDHAMMRTSRAAF